MQLPTDRNTRKDIPLARGLLDYFPAALAEVARLSKEGNDVHNPGEELHHSRGKSNDHADCILRHLTDRGFEDSDGFLHDAKVAWRALALLQEALEERGAKLARAARVDSDYLEDLDDLRTINERKDDGEFFTAREMEIFLSGYDFGQAALIDEAVDEFSDEMNLPPYSTVPSDFFTDSPDFIFMDEPNRNYENPCADDVDAYGRFAGEEQEPFYFTDEQLAEMHAKLQECEPCDPEYATYSGTSGAVANCISNRIAGDSDIAKDVKNPYYGHDPHIIRGYCANCDKELLIDDECLVKSPGFDSSILFCSIACRRRLIEWQGRVLV